MNIRILKFAMQELKFATSLESIKVIYAKIAYLLPRLTGLKYLHNRNAPWSIQLEPTNVCNLKCISCSSARSKRKKGMMDLDLFRKIADEASTIGVKRIHLYLHGEPFLHPDIIEMIKYLVEKRLPVHVTTNGMILTEQKCEELLGTGITHADHILFSVLGQSKNIHELVMKGVDNDTVIKNITSLVSLRSKNHINGPIVETIFYSMPENCSDKKSYLEFWDNKVDHVRMFDRISNSFASHNNDIKLGSVRKKTCTNIWERMTVCWNGDVTICCGDVDGDYVVGNLKTTTIMQAWNSPQLTSYRSIHKNRRFSKIPLCTYCDL